MENFEGKINLDDKIYNFVYENKILTILPNDIEENWERYSGLHYFDNRKIKKEEIINGTLRAGNSVSFIDVDLISYGRGYLRGYVPLYIISKVNNYTHLPNAGDFYSMAFYGECINKLFDNSIIISKTDFDIEKMKQILEFRSLKEIEKKSALNEDGLRLGVGIKCENKNDNIPIKLFSVLTIDFKNKKSIIELKDYFLKIYKTLCFLFNRNSISFDEIVLHRKINVFSRTIYDGEISKINNEEVISYKMIINDNLEKNELKPIKVDAEKLLNHFGNLFNLVNDNNIFSLDYYPKDIYQDTHLDSSSFIKIASAFEGQFDALYPSYKSTNKINFKEAKDKLILEIDKIIHEEKSNKKKKYNETFKELIKNFEGSLFEQIYFAMREFDSCIKQKKQKLFIEFNIKKVSNNEICEIFQKKRNELVHSFVNKPFTNEEIVGYDLVRMLIHCLVLKRANYDIDSISDIIGTIF
jgi:hypothetical protein